MINLDNPSEEEFWAEIIETKIVFNPDGNYLKHKIRCNGRDYRFVSHGTLQPLHETKTL